MNPMPPSNPCYATACAGQTQVCGAAWSSSPNAGNADNAWNVNFNNGNDNNDNKNNANQVRLVRSGQCDGLVPAAPLSFRALHSAWQSARRRKKPSHNQLAFEATWLDSLTALAESVNTGAWWPGPPVCFITTRPKAREIHAPDFADRVLHHWLVPRLEAVFEPGFIHDSFSNRSGKGTHAAVTRLQQHMRALRDGHGRGQAHYLQLGLAAAEVAVAACSASIPLTRPDSRYEAVAGSTPAGSEVRDKVTGLIWQRCVQGMGWNGSTCTGTATAHSWTAALDLARTATATTASPPTPWRLPSHAELSSLAERACTSPAINSSWFPAEPGGWAWSSSPVAGYAGYAWLVYFYYGYGFDGYKLDAYQVRLVRSGQ